MKSPRTFLLMLLSMVLLASCGSKQKKSEDEANAAATEQGADSSVSQKDLSFSAAGSDSGQIAGLSTVYFEYDSSTLTEETKAKLAENAKWIKDSKAKVQVEGHCDQRGSIEYNLALGERRAKVIRNYLVNLGVNGKQLSTISYGKEKPLVPGDDESANAKNRRANFVPLQ